MIIVMIQYARNCKVDSKPMGTSHVGIDEGAAETHHDCGEERGIMQQVWSAGFMGKLSNQMRWQTAMRKVVKG